MSYIETVAAELPAEIEAARAASLVAIAEFTAFLTRDISDCSVARMETLEADLDAAGRLVSGLTLKHDEMKRFIRRRLVEAGAPGWILENRTIFKERAE